MCTLGLLKHIIEDRPKGYPNLAKSGLDLDYYDQFKFLAIRLVKAEDVQSLANWIICFKPATSWPRQSASSFTASSSSFEGFTLGPIKLSSYHRYPWLACRPSSRVRLCSGCLLFVKLTESRPSYSADWGDYISFAERLHERANRVGVDLLLIDTGDRIEGNGLYDASVPKGAYTYDIFREQEIHVICSGNHELYRKSSAINEYLKTVPNFPGNYISSNIDIIDPRSGLRVPLAQRFKKFTTKNQGIRVLAFGFLFDFTGNANNTIVQPVKETIKEQWFQQAIRDREVDLFLVAGHVPLRSEEFNAIYKAIREVQWDVPIQFFGGHTHIRDYVKYDSKAHALESGRYLETIGFMSITGLSAGGTPYNPHVAPVDSKQMSKRVSPKFARRYIDNNLFSFHHHTSLNDTTFPTSHGRNVSAMITSARKALGLEHQFGCAPGDLWTNRAPYPSESSIFNWLENQVLPDMMHDEKRGDTASMVIINTGAMRFDIFEGAFTVDTAYAVSPFMNGFHYIQNIPFEIAKKVLMVINNGGIILAHEADALHSKVPVSQKQLEILKTTSLRLNYQSGVQDQIVLGAEESKLLPGYTTVDDAGSDGDDTPHLAIKFYRVPNCIESRIGFTSCTTEDDPTAAIQDGCEDPNTVDLVFLDFIQPYILAALKFLGSDYDVGDTKTYMKGMDMTTLITTWVTEHWKGEC